MLSSLRLELQLNMRLRGMFALYQKATCNEGESDFCYSVEKYDFLTLPVSDRGEEGFVSLGKAYVYRSSDEVYC